ncbi:MAG: class I SAM-dependent methyltransferase [Treponemataceae bacterium]
MTLEKVNYKNWVPKQMIIVCCVLSLLCSVCAVLFGILFTSVALYVVVVLLSLMFLFFLSISIWSILAYKAFSYDGKKQISKKIIQGVASYVTVPNGGKALDVGCGSGALTIACAKKNPQGTIVGVDRWGKEYSSFSKNLCEKNAALEGVTNVSFEKGDAVKLEFEDETFDAVTSNYVYHNVVSVDKQKLLWKLCES